MKPVTEADFSAIRIPKRDSHKGQNGKLLLIGGSHLFHAASLWALTVASRIVDLVHYASVPENNDIVQKAKEEFRNGIVVRREDVDAYIQEDDCILLGVGMTRDEETEDITNTILKKYPEKQWVIDAGALQMMDLSLIPHHAILTPHHGEFRMLCERSSIPTLTDEAVGDEEKVMVFAETYHCIVLLKGERDILCGNKECRVIKGGNVGLTKGGTGDVLSGLIAALACTNDPFVATFAGSYINKKAGDVLFERVGPYYNATDVANQVPETMKMLLSG